MAFVVITAAFQVATLEYSATSSVTVDEFAHLPAGVANWETGTFYSYRENPPFIRGLLSLPPWLMGAKMDYSNARGGLGQRSEWQIGSDFLHANGSRYRAIYGSARFVNVVLATVCGMVIFFWSHERAGGLAALACSSLWFADPNVIAHAGLATIDVGASAFGCIATYTYWRNLRNPNRRWVLASGIALGAAITSKFSLLSLYPAWLLLAGLAAITRRRAGAGGEAGKARKPLLNFLAIGSLGILTLNAIYLFEGSFTNLDSYSFVSRTFSGERQEVGGSTAGNRFRGSLLGSLPVPLPKDYVLGLDSQKREEDIGFANLVGGRLTRRQAAHWYSPFVTLGLKLPSGTLLLLAASLVLRVASRRGPSPVEVVLLVAVSSIMIILCVHIRINWIFRYALPVLPLLFILCSTSILAAISRPIGKALVIICISMNVLGVLSTRPFYLSYGNALAGGQAGAQRLFLGSNYDWGQDFIRLKRWIGSSSEGLPVAISHYGPDDPHLLGMHSMGLPPAFLLREKPESVTALGSPPDDDSDFFWAISSNILHGFQGPMPLGRGDEEFIGVLASPLLVPDRAVARVGSIFLFKVTRTRKPDGQSIFVGDLKGCVRKAGSQDYVATP